MIGPAQTGGPSHEEVQVQPGAGGLRAPPGRGRDAGPAALSDSTDLRVGNALAFDVLAALWHRRDTGQGGLFDLVARETVATYMGEQIIDYQMHGRLGVYRCPGDDRWVSIAVASNDEFAGLCQAIGQPDLAADEHFWARGAFLPIDQPGLGELPVLMPACRRDAAPSVPHDPTPLLAEHNTWVLGDVLALSPDRVRALENEGSLI